MSDLRLLSRHPNLEFVDLTNNPIVHLDYYQEFIAIFVRNLKMLDRKPVDRARMEQVRQDSKFIRDLLSTLREFYFKIVTTKSITQRLAINEEFRTKYGVEEKAPHSRSEQFDILQQNILENIDENALIEFEAYLLDDLEMIMDQLFPDKM